MPPDAFHFSLPRHENETQVVGKIATEKREDMKTGIFQ